MTTVDTYDKGFPSNSLITYNNNVIIQHVKTHFSSSNLNSCDYFDLEGKKAKWGWGWEVGQRKQEVSKRILSWEAPLCPNTETKMII